MSTERFEITDRGELIAITEPDGTTTEICGTDPGGGAYLDDVVIGAIRQQARDLALLTQMLHDQRLVIDDLEHRRVKVCDENDQLRTDLATAVAERDQWCRRAKLSEAKEALAEARLAAIDGAPTVAHMRRWEYDGVTPFKERNANGRMAWPAKFKILPVTSSIRSANVKAKGIFADDVELIARPAKD